MYGLISWATTFKVLFAITNHKEKFTTNRQRKDTCGNPHIIYSRALDFELILILCSLFYFIFNLNTFVPNAPFLHPLKTPETLEGVERGCISNEQVNIFKSKSNAPKFGGGISLQMHLITFQKFVNTVLIHFPLFVQGRYHWGALASPPIILQLQQGAIFSCKIYITNSACSLSTIII